MITSIHIENFESHKNTTINLVNGVNIIVGRTDSGKSSIRRAVNWVCKNRPTGDSFVSWWGGPTIVTLTLSSGDTVSRIKDGSKNLYKINERELTAFGTDVPKEVQQLLNISDVNLQAQFDRPFLLDSTPGEVATHFNKIARIDVINKSINNVTTWQKALEKKVQIKLGVIQENTIKLEQYSKLDKIVTEYEVLEGMDREVIEHINKKNKLNQIIKDLEGVNTEIEEKQEIVKVEPYLNTLIELYKSKEDLESELQGIQNLILNINKHSQTIKEKSSIIKAEEYVTAIINQYEKMDELEEEYQELNTMINSITSTETSLTRVQTSLKKNQEEFTSKFPDICPLCNNPVKKGSSLFKFDEGLMEKAFRAEDKLTKLI